MQRTKILYVIDFLNVGGTEQHLVSLLSRLDANRWEPIVYCLKARGELARELEAHQIHVEVSPVSFSASVKGRLCRIMNSVAVTIRLASYIRQTRPSIAHFFLPGAYVFGAPAAILTRVPIRVMSRRSLNAYQKDFWLARVLEPWLHPFMRAILGNSRSVVRELEENEAISHSRLGLIYNDIDDTAYGDRAVRHGTRVALGVSPTAFVMAIVANLIPYKGHQDLFAALAAVSACLPKDWRLLVIGRDDGIGGALREQAQGSGIGDNIIFTGPRRDVPAVLAASDVGLLCSHEEGFSNAVLEGMASGLPMIVTDVGGNAEAVVDGFCGIVVPPRDTQMLGRAIVRLANDFALRSEFGAAARRQVKERFSFNRGAEAYDALYRKLLEGGGPEDVPECRIVS